MPSIPEQGKCSVLAWIRVLDQALCSTHDAYVGNDCTTATRVAIVPGEGTRLLKYNGQDRD